MYIHVHVWCSTVLNFTKLVDILCEYFTSSSYKYYIYLFIYLCKEEEEILTTKVKLANFNDKRFV